MLPASSLALHEAVHAVVAHRLGLPVACAIIDPARDEGSALIVHDGTGPHLQKAAIATAAAVLFDRKLGRDPVGHEDDLHRVSDLHRRFQVLTGGEMPDAFEDAAAFFRDPAVAADVLAVARRLDAAGQIGQAELEALVSAPPVPGTESAS